MLINAYRERPAAIPGTRLLEATFDMIGTRLPDPQQPERVWEVQGFYLPIHGRALGGIRAKFTDQKGFVAFCNQRDLEVLLGIGVPGKYCAWAGAEYVGPDYEEWFGFCCDEEDLKDDLFERELFLRAQLAGGVLTTDCVVERRVHLSKNNDHEELFVVVQDFDPETGIFPDLRFETLERRWARAERSRLRWERA